MPKVSQGCETNKAHTDAHPTKSEWDSAENLIDGADGEQSLSLATDRAEMVLMLMKSQNVAIYSKK